MSGACTCGAAQVVGDDALRGQRSRQGGAQHAAVAVVQYIASQGAVGVGQGQAGAGRVGQGPKGRLRTVV